MDSHHFSRGPVLVIWALAVITFTGLVILNPANLVTLSLVLLAYAAIARWVDPNRNDMDQASNKTQDPETNLAIQENSPKSRAA
jgi:hypothetical protein